MLLANADSLMRKIKASNFYEDFYKDRELPNFTNYSNDSKF